jgi:DAK2 domain fusion protein YloV
METLERLGAAHLRSVISVYRDTLRAHQDRINRLNVYPVPDGDTGTNMALTMESVVAELDGCADELPAVCKALSHGSLMGARGNSGVILSQILRGLAKAFEEAGEVGPGSVKAAFRQASDAAYSAVGRPVEGTILTVARRAAEGAESAAGSLTAVLDAARDGAATALDETPELLPVLKAAGVVDAGGAGFVLLLDSFLSVIDGRPLPDAGPVVARATQPSGASVPSADGGGAPVAPEHDPIGDLRYEVMYLLEGDDLAVPAFKEVWAGIGDSIVVVGGDGLWNCHIHTDDIGAAIEAALDVGRPRSIRVTDLFEQVEEERWVRDAADASAGDAEDVGEPVPTAVVAIATGEGIRRIFRSLGVHQVVAGGQSMNPSTAQILEAVEKAPAGEVVVLPNNKNIVPVAEQVADLTTKVVRVVPTHSVAEGFAALLEYDPQSPAEENAESMLRAAGRVTAAEITRAVRASTCPAGPINEGDYLGLSRAGIEVVAATLAEAATALLAKLVTDEHEIVTLIEGEGASAAETRRMTEWLKEHHPAVQAEVHHGGQPLYPYLLSIE